MTIATVVSGRGVLVRGVATTVAVTLVDDTDTVVTPTSWAATLVRGGQAVTTGSGGGAASWTVTVSATAALGEDYAIHWSIVHAGGTVVHRQEAAVYLQRLYGVVRVADLIERVPRLDPDCAEPMLSATASESRAILRAAIDSAWQDIEDWLISQGRRPSLILSPQATRRAHLEHALEIVLHGAAVSLGGEVAALADNHRDAYMDALRSMTLRYEEPTGGDDGKPYGARAPMFAGGSFSTSLYDYQRPIPRGGR